MIQTFGNVLAKDLFYDKRSKATRLFPPELRRTARRKLLYLHNAVEMKDLRIPPGNRLESLKGKRKGFHAIRMNDQWRLVFQWSQGQAYNVQIIDYH